MLDSQLEEDRLYFLQILTSEFYHVYGYQDPGQDY